MGPELILIAGLIGGPVIGKTIDYFAGDRDDTVTACQMVDHTRYCRQIDKADLPVAVRAALYGKPAAEYREALADGQIVRGLP